MAVIRTAKSVLAPSPELLKDWKSGKITWGDYEARCRKEILSNSQAVRYLHEIKKLAKTKDIYLVCYERRSPCHRFILLDLIKESVKDVARRKMGQSFTRRKIVFFKELTGKVRKEIKHNILTKNLQTSSTSPAISDIQPQHPYTFIRKPSKSISEHEKPIKFFSAYTSIREEHIKPYHDNIHNLLSYIEVEVEFVWMRSHRDF